MVSVTTIKDGDAVIFLNYRGDRPRELTKAFVYDDDAWKSIEGGGFDRGKRIDQLYFATMTGYETGLPVHVIFEKPPKMPNILGEYVSSLGLHQFRCAETEKYPHVTFFFNDYRDDPFAKKSGAWRRHRETFRRTTKNRRCRPKRSLKRCSAKSNRATRQLIVVNYANGDMVGHTGVLKAAVEGGRNRRRLCRPSCRGNAGQRWLAGRHRRPWQL